MFVISGYLFLGLVILVVAYGEGCKVVERTEVVRHGLDGIVVEVKFFRCEGGNVPEGRKVSGNAVVADIEHAQTPHLAHFRRKGLEIVLEEIQYLYHVLRRPGRKPFQGIFRSGSRESVVGDIGLYDAAHSLDACRKLRKLRTVVYHEFRDEGKLCECFRRRETFLRDRRICDCQTLQTGQVSYVLMYARQVVRELSMVHVVRPYLEIRRLQFLGGHCRYLVRSHVVVESRGTGCPSVESECKRTCRGHLHAGMKLVREPFSDVAC